MEHRVAHAVGISGYQEGDLLIFDVTGVRCRAVRDGRGIALQKERTMDAGLHIEESGRRLYVVGPTYPIREALRGAGCRWDGDRKAWWIGVSQRTTIEDVLAQLAQASPAAAAASEQAPGPGAVVAGRATWRGHTYYLAGRVERGRTSYDDRVRQVESPDGGRLLLYYRDGSRSAWAAATEVAIAQRYERPQTIGGLARFASQRRQERSGTRECPACAQHCTCPRWCQHHHDGCPRCGAET